MDVLDEILSLICVEIYHGKRVDSLAQCTLIKLFNNGLLRNVWHKLRTWESFNSTEVTLKLLYYVEKKKNNSIYEFIKFIQIWIQPMVLINAFFEYWFSVLNMMWNGNGETFMALGLIRIELKLWFYSSA